MASVEQHTRAETNGSATADGIPVENPATGELITTVPNLSESEIAEMVARARAAQPGWAARGFEERGRVFLRAQKWMLDNADRVIDVVASETGKTVEDVQLVDLGYTVSALGFWAKQGPKYLADERVASWKSPTTLGRKLVIRYAPLGVVGVIGPWNFPISNSFGDAIPALVAGNTVVLKPSEVTPLSSLLMEEMLAQCGMPEGAFQVATGDGGTGAALIGEVDCVMFTGSTATGRKVAKAAAEALIPCYLELGGKDPMIVCADADIERAANAASFYSMNNAGQVCISIERVYVEAPVYDEFVERVTDNVRALRQGAPDGGPGTVDVGAVIFPPQIEIVDDHVRDAVDKGARVLTGGQIRPGAGRYYEPTVLVDVDHSMKCMTEETFGPTIPIMKVGNVEDAVSLANDSAYGLQASVWTNDIGRGEALARRMEAGVVCVNDAQINYTALNLPMGGWKSSGIGTRHGAGGIRKYCKIQSLLVTRRSLKRELFMFPYKAGRTKLLRRGFAFLYGRGDRG
ncbi:MAG TPA: aldehyde dehydrogenase family protein [Solirubrobacteraceae bacterium]|jgi:acyl-CoA reductase-like NAD-dependent aldehyde dehydrogenase|nr:aldehyde dehydrogenase family protein [Solirubrobacteraceae bacterium]